MTTKETLRFVRLLFKHFKIKMGRRWSSGVTYDSKENYVASQPDPQWWAKHINGTHILQYQKYLTGAVADLGCNHGASTMLVAQLPSVEKVTGLDFNAEAIKVANECKLKYFKDDPTRSGKLNFKQANFVELQIPDNSFNALVSFHTLEHLYSKDLKRAMGEFHRVLKDGGYFMATVPHLLAYFDSTHEQMFTVKSLSKLFESSGFKVLECYRDRRTDAYTADGHDCIVILAQKSAKSLS